MRVLAERRPELAERLERLRQEDPERFEAVVMDAFVVRMEHALAEAEADLDHRGGPHQTPAEREERLRERELDQRMSELHMRHEQLEQRSHELAEMLHRLREEGTDAENAQRLRAELTSLVEEHFELRGALRQAELERIESELHRLNETVERMRNDLEQRERERGAIIERRVRELLGDDRDGW